MDVRCKQAKPLVCDEKDKTCRLAVSTKALKVTKPTPRKLGRVHLKADLVSGEHERLHMRVVAERADMGGSLERGTAANGRPDQLDAITDA